MMETTEISFIIHNNSIFIIDDIELDLKEYLANEIKKRGGTIIKNVRELPENMIQYLIIDPQKEETKDYKRMIRVRKHKSYYDQRTKTLIISHEDYEKYKDVDAKYLNHLGDKYQLEYTSSFETIVKLRKMFPAYEIETLTRHDNVPFLSHNEVEFKIFDPEYKKGGVILNLKSVFDQDLMRCGGFHLDNPYNAIYYYNDNNELVRYKEQRLKDSSRDEMLKVAERYIRGKLCVLSAIDKDGFWASDVIMPEDIIKDTSADELKYLWDMEYYDGTVLKPEDVSRIHITFFKKSLDYCYNE